jgi:protein transport protein SEC13
VISLQLPRSSQKLVLTISLGGRFPSVVWRVSWSLAGNILAVSCADGKVSLWKENLKGVWECVSEMDS